MQSKDRDREVSSPRAEVIHTHAGTTNMRLFGGRRVCVLDVGK